MKFQVKADVPHPVECLLYAKVAHIMFAPIFPGVQIALSKHD